VGEVGDSNPNRTVDIDSRYPPFPPPGTNLCNTTSSTVPAC
jgi:hypothetical protein